MRTLLVSIIVATNSTALAEPFIPLPELSPELHRSTKASWPLGMGPDHLEGRQSPKLSGEFGAVFYRTYLPRVNRAKDAKQVPLKWEKVPDGVSIELNVLAHREGRPVIAVQYKIPAAKNQGFAQSILILCLGTEDGYSRPFFHSSAVAPDSLDFSVVSTQDLPLAVVASYDWDGTAAMRLHQLFDVSAKTPRFVKEEGFGRIRATDPEEYDRLYREREHAERRILTGG